MPRPADHTFALIVFGGKSLDFALATDFVMISKKFIADGLDPTCISGTNLYDIVLSNGPFLFGREDLRDRLQIYDLEEAQRPFYRLETHGIKCHVMNWIRNVSTQITAGNRVIIILIAHGDPEYGDVVMYPQHANPEKLSKGEMIAALRHLPQGIRLLLVNEACFSGTWVTAAPELGAERDVLIETSSTIGEQAWSYTSGSGRNRCSMFAAAFVEEITSYPEGKISQHHSRIVEEMRHKAPSQETSTPQTIPSARALFSHNISHFILSPRIAIAIMGLASNQDRHEALLRSRASGREFWRRARNLVGLNRGHAQALGAENTDMRDVALLTYLDELGTEANSLSNNALTEAIKLALQGRGPADLKDKSLATITWQRAQLLQVRELLKNLAKDGLITDIVEMEVALEAMAEHREDILEPLARRIRRHKPVEDMITPPADGHLPIYFPDGRSWLVFALAYNQLKYPHEFDIERVEREVFRWIT